MFGLCAACAIPCEKGNEMTKVTSKQLRNCSARVFDVHNAGGHAYLLRSYASNVMEVYRADSGTWCITLFPRWNYSPTTNQHVRKFMQDYMGVVVSVPEIREAMKHPVRDGVARIPNKNVEITWKPAILQAVRAYWSQFVSGEWGF